MLALILALFFFANPQQSGYPPFDWNRAKWDDSRMTWCDPNYCIGYSGPNMNGVMVIPRGDAPDESVRRAAQQGERVIRTGEVGNRPQPDLSPLFQPQPPTDYPPFDWNRAKWDETQQAWCDPNYCVLPPDRYNDPFTPWPCNKGSQVCGWARLDAEDPGARQLAIDQTARCAQNFEICYVPISYVGNPPIPPKTPPGGPGGGGNNPGGQNPGNNPGNRNPRPTPPPSADKCPLPEVVREPPRIEPLTSRPPYPVVVGQDPERVGVIYEMVVRVPPVVYRRWEREPEMCVPVPDADGDGKPDRGGNCWTAIGDPPVRWPGDLKPGECRLVEERYADPVAGEGLLVMTLRQSSREWIEGELAQRYPGARVRMPEIRLPIRGEGEVLGDKTFVLRAAVNPKPVDPGIYDVDFVFRTSGTPVSDPIEVRRRIEQKVWLMESTIVR